jgi:hypothetical protein
LRACSPLYSGTSSGYLMSCFQGKIFIKNSFTENGFWDNWKI